MKPSVFNFAYTRDQGTYAVFNTFSRAVIEFESQDKYHEIINGSCSAHPEDTYRQEAEELARNGLIVSDETDELAVLKYFHYKAKFTKEHLILTVAPTLACNFACPYCYETPRHGHMSEAVQNALIQYIGEKINDGVKDIDFTWYGGEPLLYPEIIDYVSSQIRKMAEEKAINVHFTMVTNGSLVTKEIVSMLVKNKINSIQITMDGMKENHDMRRPLRNGKSSFEAIMQNLKLFAQSGIRINVRMNVDQQNRRDYSELKQMIEGLKPQMEIALYPALVEHLNKNDTRPDIYLSGSEYADFISENYGDKKTEADDGLALAKNRRYFCTAELDNCYVIDEKGNCYKCWDEIGREDLICFNLLEKEKVNYDAIARYLTDDPFQEQSKCRTCVFLPLCFGGCRYQKKYFGHTRCSFTESGLIDYIEKKYFQ